jgi:hypothetical protein
MTSHHDEERIPVPDERAPLLGRDDARQGEADEDGDSEPSIEQQKTTSRTWEYVWKGSLAIFMVLIVAVFVKGWIDADDVDVSLVQPGPRTNADHMIHRSSTSTVL